MIVIMLERIQEAILYTEQTDCRAKSELMLTFSWPGARGQPTTAPPFALLPYPSVQ